MTSHTPKFFDIFLSSPGDVPEERDTVEEVVKDINSSGEFTRHFTLRLYRWDDKNIVIPMPVTNTPQKSVDVYMTRPSACDLTVVIFWSRMGSPLVMDEREYLSGTHYEYSDAREAYEKQKKPVIWLYRRLEEPSIKLTDPKRDEKIQQFDRVTQFFSQFQDADGRFIGGVNSYLMHPDFKPLFKGQLLAYLRHLRDTPPDDAGHQVSKKDEPVPPKFSGTPYKGLSALDETDAPIFFGREAEKLEVMVRVEGNRLVFVLGASGSGKSSLVAAGILPRFRNKGWNIVRCVPGEDPFFNVALALLPPPADMGAKLQAYLKEARHLAAQLSAEPKALVTKLQQVAVGKRALLFIDQFEEVFTLAEKNPNLSPNTISIFLQAIQYPSTTVTTLLTMRADFYGVALPHFDDLKQRAYGLTKPSVFALYEMVMRPAQLAALAFEAGLAERIVDEAGTQSGALALISYVLEALYNLAQARGDGVMSTDDYTHKLHGVSGAINTLADQAYQRLPFDETRRQIALRRVITQLVTLTEEDGQLIPTRRRVALAQFAPESDEAIFIENFTQARLLVKGDGQMVEVAHEAILLHWGALADWIAQVKGDLALLRQYERDAKTWEQRGKDTPPPSQEALDYFHKALITLGLTWEGLDEPLKSYTEPEQARLLREIEKNDTNHERRRDIGERLAVIGDTRVGVGVKDGLPDILWLPVDGSDKPTIIKTDKNEIGPVMIPPFFAAKYLITYLQFDAFLKAPDGFENEAWWAGMPEDYIRQSVEQQRTKTANSPRDSVSWYQAVAFTRWLNHRSQGLTQTLPSGLILRVGENAEIRLPTEWEWQWMAQGGNERREYPWGAWQEGYANTSEAGLNRTTAVGMYPHGAAQAGAEDAAGNLWEWCLNDHENPGTIEGYGNGQSKVLRGGSFSSNRNPAAASYRYSDYPPSDGSYLGFRVVLSAPIASLASGSLISESE